MGRRHLLLSLLLGLAGGLLLTAGLASADTAPLPPVEHPDGRAGLCYSFYADGSTRPFVPLAYDAGSRWDRFDFAWPSIEPSDDDWNFGPHDGLVNDLRAAHLNIIGILLWTPDWAATAQTGGASPPSLADRPPGWYAPLPGGAGLAPQGATAFSSPPRGLDLPWNHPGNYWGDFVYHVVAHYGDRVKHWEMWNEPEWDYFWSGTSNDYAQLLKVGYQATKAACPDCTVLFGGLHYWANQSYYRWVLNTLDSDPLADQNNHFFDVMSVHLYSRASSLYDEIENIRSGMAAYGVDDHPIWVTETGVPVWGDPHVSSQPKYDYAATQEEAAAYVIQSYANSWAAGVARYMFFRTHDADMSEYFGLIRNDRTLRPGYVAYQVAATHLVSPTFVTRALSGTVRTVTLWGTPSGRVSVLWNESPTPATYTLPAALPTATLVTRQGTTAVLTTTTGYLLNLPGATANLVSDPDDYIIGGDPLILVESEESNLPPTSTVRPLPPMTTALSITVAWGGRDNQSGIASYDLQVRDGAAGLWADWLVGTVVTSARFVGEPGHTYYFRSRATDRVGNRAPWPDAPQAWVTLNLTGTVAVSVTTFFADDNRNGVWDIISGTASLIYKEITLTQVALHLLDGTGQDVVTPVITRPWTLRAVVRHSQQPYLLRAAAFDGRYERRIPLTITWGSVYSRTYPTLGLWPVARLYLPLILRGE